jgi:hypothetical protein
MGPVNLYLRYAEFVSEAVTQHPHAGGIAEAFHLVGVHLATVVTLPDRPALFETEPSSGWRPLLYCFSLPFRRSK